MKREWKPGDVAKVSLRKKNEASIDGALVHIAMRDRTESWACGTTYERRISDDDVKEARPLVVIDPEDREQVERLLADYYTRLNPRMGRVAAEPSLVGDMQAALREFARPGPPKPEEPTGLGAVVEDAEGAKWTWGGERNVNNEQHWRRTSDQRGAAFVRIEAVRVLSEGVQP